MTFANAPHARLFPVGILALTAGISVLPGLATSGSTWFWQLFWIPTSVLQTRSCRSGVSLKHGASMFAGYETWLLRTSKAVVYPCLVNHASMS